MAPYHGGLRGSLYLHLCRGARVAAALRRPPTLAQMVQVTTARESMSVFSQ